jgi:hypothetical protein
VKPGDRRAVTRAKTTAATKIVSVRLWPSRQTVLDAINSFSDFLGTGETYPVKNGSYVMRCISFIGVLFVCPPSSTYLCGGRIAICVPTAILISPKLPVRIPGMKVSIAAIAEA